MKKLLFILLFPVCCFAQRQNLLLEATFDGNDPFTGFNLSGHQFCCSYSITQVPAPAGQSLVLRYELRRTDEIVSSSVRAEIELPASIEAPETSERWYGLRYYLQDYGADDGAESILQWHDRNNTCPPLSIQVQSNQLRLQQCINNSNTGNPLGQVISNTWFDIVMRVKWSSSNNGLIQLWKNGSLVVNKPNIRTNSSGGSYLKLGINKWSWAPGGGSSSQSKRIFFIDDFRMGSEKATYDDVAPVPLIVTPVLWGYFRYNDILSRLEWSTETEQNNDHFDIEESDDGSTWHKVGQVASAAIDGNSSLTTKYFFSI